MLLLHHLLDPVDVMCVLQSVYEESKEGTRNARPQNQIEQNEYYYPHYDPAHEPNLLGGNTGLLGIAVHTHHWDGVSAPRLLNGERLLLYGSSMKTMILMCLSKSWASNPVSNVPQPPSDIVMLTMGQLLNYAIYQEFQTGYGREILLSYFLPQTLI